MKRDHDEGHRPELLAALYGLLLRAEGLPPDEAAHRVIERYPRARWRMGLLLRQTGVVEAGSDSTDGHCEMSDCASTVDLPNSINLSMRR